MKRKSILTNEEKLTFVTAFIGKLTDKERESVIKYGGDLYRNGYYDGYKRAIMWGAIGVFAGSIIISYIEDKKEEKKKTKVYSFDEIKEESTKKGEKG